MVCALVQDRLSAVLDQIAPDDASALLAVRGEDTTLHLLGVASRALPHGGRSAAPWCSSRSPGWNPPE
ncbi:hypothetical protein [Streptomyces sparsogenes]|uniref:hypothetical protein n=1 Tax=Streptomyces sparsogenes TaxID=67365 RepID=UPI0033F0ED31